MCTIRELLDKGISRDEVAAELVRGDVASNLVDANFIVAISLGEIQGDVLNADLNVDPLYFIKRLSNSSEAEST